jgi:hypothetical protein
MDDPAPLIAARPGASTQSPDKPRRGARAKARRRMQGAARRRLWAVLTFLMLVVGGAAACQAPAWFGPAHHEPGLAKPPSSARP